MTIFGKRLSEYVAFSKPFLVLILVVGIVRLAMSLGGVPNSTQVAQHHGRDMDRSLYYAIRVHTSGFGSYKHLLPICVLQSLAAQVIIVPAIILAIFTGKDNIYSVPEYASARRQDLASRGGPSMMGTTIGPLIGWLVGCVIMFVTKKLVTKDKEQKPRCGRA